MSKESILEEFKIFAVADQGIGAWLTEKTSDEVFKRLDAIEEQPLSQVQLNQLLVFGHEAPVSDDFFKYYWLEVPQGHPYPVDQIPGYLEEYVKYKEISSLQHLRWGLYRLFCDGLIFFGNVRTGYQKLRALTKDELESFFFRKRINTQQSKERGPALPLNMISKDNRYLISEMACKSLGGSIDLKNILLEAYRDHQETVGGRIEIRELLSKENLPREYKARQIELNFSADEILDESINSVEEANSKIAGVCKKFNLARDAALGNTNYYLSMVNELDVYVATSMRTREDFRKMADFCDNVFSDAIIKNLQLRYFDPTLSAAAGHEDKGLIECLMVKCARVLVYHAGAKESYGKDAEAAMALSLGKPVIFYCDQEQRSRFYREVHPLSRLIEFTTGVAVGAIVTDKIEQVIELLYRIFENKMEYKLEKAENGCLRVREVLTDSVVRLQTSDRMLAETFWNHYHNRDFSQSS